MTITIRELLLSDIEPVMALCEQHFLAVNMDGRLHSFNLEDSQRTLKAFVENEAIDTLIAVDGDSYEGIITFIKQPSLFDYSHVKISEILWYATSPRLFINLFKIMEARLVEGNEATMHIGIPTDNSVRKFLEKRGYKLTEYVLSRRVLNV